MLLSAGYRVPADLRLTAVTDLFLAGCHHRGKCGGGKAAAPSATAALAVTQLENLAFMATTVISGKGEGVVVAVGKNTLYGSFSKDDPEAKKRPFRKVLTPPGSHG